MKSDIEIAREANMQPIQTVAEKLDITADELDLYGKYKAKLTDELWELTLIHISEPTRPY